MSTRRLPLLLAALLSPPAAAADLPCEPVENDLVQVDGLLDDWADAKGVDVGGQDPGFSFTVRCGYDDHNLYLAVDVRDDKLVRRAGGGGGDDRVEVAIADGAATRRLTIYPADLKRNVKQKLAWAGKPIKGAGVLEALQMKGWSVEVKLPLGSLPEWQRGAPMIRLGVGVTDGDGGATRSLSTSPLGTVDGLGSVEFAEARSALEAFFKDRKLSQGDVRFSAIGRVAPVGRARAILAGRFLAVITTEYAYAELPIAVPEDLKEVRLIDPWGDGNQAVLVRHVERGGGGERELLALYRMAPEGMRRFFGCELAKSFHGKRLESKVSYVKKGAATEILVEALPATGWTEETYREATAEDIVPVLLPWSERKKARFRFKGDTYFQVE